MLDILGSYSRKARAGEGHIPARPEVDDLVPELLKDAAVDPEPGGQARHVVARLVHGQEEPDADRVHVDPDHVRRRRVGDHPVDVVLRHLHPQAVLLRGVAQRGALDLHEEEIRRPVHHLDDVVERGVLIAQEPGPEERVVPPAEVGHEEAEQPLPAFPDVLSGHLLTCWQAHEYPS